LIDRIRITHMLANNLITCIKIESCLMMFSWPLCASSAFSGSATASASGDAIAAVSISGSFREAIADIQLLH
jgi:hypothetical protein